MNITSLIGIGLIIFALYGGMSFELHSSVIFNEKALFIVVIGTLGSLILQSSFDLFLNALKLLKWIIFPPAKEHHKFIELIVEWSATARRSGLASLSPFIEDLEENFQIRALQMLTNGVDPNEIQSNLYLEIEAYRRRTENHIQFWEFAGKYAIWTGLLGALIFAGIHGNFTQPQHLSALIYGIILSTLILTPISQRLRYLMQEQILLKQMLIDGVVSIGNGENPKAIQIKLASYLP